MQKALHDETITFGKYKGKTLTDVLKDRGYCKWLQDQEWFKNGYEYLYNRVCEYDPKIYFFPDCPASRDEFKDVQDFLENFPFFNLTKPEDLKIDISVCYKACYGFYMVMIDFLKNRIIERVENGDKNPYNIKAPVKWLKNFEKETGFDREIFKEFLQEFELLNITSIIERIKKEGGLEYLGAKSYKIAKKRSEAQEQFWEIKLKEKYGEDIGVQFKLDSCIFDMIHINKNTIYECKLGIKDFVEEQYVKYLVTLGNYSTDKDNLISVAEPHKYDIIYLVGYDIIVHIPKETIYIQSDTAYEKYILERCIKKNCNRFDELIRNYEVLKVDNIIDYV